MNGERLRQGVRQANVYGWVLFVLLCVALGFMFLLL